MTETPPTAPPVLYRILTAVATISLHILSLIVAIVFLCMIVPEYTHFFDQADVLLPHPTLQVIELSWLFVSYWYLIIFLAVILDSAIVGVLALFAWKRTWLLSIYSHCWLVAVILLLFWIGITLCIPIRALTAES